MDGVISDTDMKRYLEHVSSIDLSDIQKIELISIIYAISSHFVDHAHGLQSDNLAMNSRQTSYLEANFRRANNVGTPTFEPSATRLPGLDTNSRRPSEP